MSYQVLARKWRPKNFEQLMGQEHVVTVLVNALTQERLHHAYLFTGTRGVGKTTIARIFAKSLNCESGITATPCGICDTCKDIDQGRYIDLLEIDAASRTKVDDTREILDNVQYSPSRGRYKVYLIDEVHMLSRSSFNALLKTLEEPPEHVKFILATTDPQKLPVTVLSRCLQFHLKALTVLQIETKLLEILQAEEVTTEPGAINLLAKAARGSMRDSLSLTDQAIAQGQGNISVANVQAMLGGVDQNWVYKILIALIKQDAQELMQLSLHIASYAPNYGRLFAELIQLLHQVAMSQIIGKHFDLLPEHQVLLAKFCQALSPEDVQLYYQIALTGRKDLPYACDEQAAFDMVLLRMLAFKPTPIAQDESSVAQNKIIAANKHPAVNFNDVVLPEATSVIETSEIKVDNVTKQALSAESVPPTESLSTSLPKYNVSDEETEQEDISISQAELLHSEQLSIEESAASQGYQSAVQDIENTLPHEAVDHATHDTNQAVNESLALSDDENRAQTLSNPAVESTSPEVNISPSVNAAIATRNMLRSRRKALEKNVKKSDDASARHNDVSNNTHISTNEAQKEHSEQVTSVPEVPNINTLVQQDFSPEKIDPTVIRFANQVDEWAKMIDSMALTGLIRQLAIHATICKTSTEDRLVLSLDQSMRHLHRDKAHKALEGHLREALGRKINVELNIVEQTIADPYQIQSQINDKRSGYVKKLLHEDNIVQALKENFQATLDDDTIVSN